MYIFSPWVSLSLYIHIYLSIGNIFITHIFLMLSFLSLRTYSYNFLRITIFVFVIADFGLKARYGLCVLGTCWKFSWIIGAIGLIECDKNSGHWIRNRAAKWDIRGSCGIKWQGKLEFGSYHYICIKNEGGFFPVLPIDPVIDISL